MDKENLVKEGYDKISEKFLSFRQQFDNSLELEKFITYLPKDGKVLDVGCGVGIPVAKYLVENSFDLTGIDISDGMLSKARVNVPEAKFLQYNMTDLDFLDNYFDGLVSIYALFHVPKQKHEQFSHFPQSSVSFI